MKSFKDIETKLVQLSDAYARLYPPFYAAELVYITKRAEILMSQSVAGLGSQSLRDAEMERIMSQTPEYTTYHLLKPEVDVVTRQTWLWAEISKLVRSSQFEKDL